MQEGKLITLEQWSERRQSAQELMAERASIRRLLIEISTQHPLLNGETPGEEFSARLELGRRLYQEALDAGLEVEIVVGGSRHREGEHTDKISLSEAGKVYLIVNGVPEHLIHGDDLIARYKGPQSRWPGIYNSSDEAYVASQYFKDGNFGRIYSVVAPAQLHRKALTYTWCGVLSLFYTAPTAQAFHDFVGEMKLLEYVYTVDPDLQAPDSQFAELSRKMRVPNDNENPYRC